MQAPRDYAELDLEALKRKLRARAGELGFDALGVSGIELEDDERRLEEWLAAGYHGAMSYMARHGTKRSRPAELVPGSVRAICVRMNYWPAEARDPFAVLADPESGYVSRYALGRDYHKVMRGALARLGAELGARIGPYGYRVCVDSAPVLEKALARAAGLGWIGKHTNLLARDAGSWFFLGEILTDLPLPIDTAATSTHNRCGGSPIRASVQRSLRPSRRRARSGAARRVRVAP